MKRVRVPLSYPAPDDFDGASGSLLGWQLCRGISGSFRVEWVADFVWNQWQPWSGIRTNSQLIARTVEYARPYLYASPSYVKRFGEPAEPSDLTNHQRLVYGLGVHSTGWNLVTSSGSEVSIDGGRKLRFDSGEAIRESALHGMGVAYLPSFLVNDDVESGRLIKLLPNYGGKRLPIQVVYVSRNHLAQKIRLFIDGLVKHRQGG